MGRLMFGVLLAFLVAVGAWGAKRHLDRQAELQAFEESRDRLRDARARADSCAITLGWEQERFLHFDGVVDSLRSAVREFEDSDRGGVPEEDYPDYLAVFGAYNDSVAVWQERADAVQVAEAACRTYTESHNALRDSIQARFGDEDGAGG